MLMVYLERQPGNTNEIDEYNKKETKIKKQSIKYCMKTKHSSKKREIRKKMENECLNIFSPFEINR